MSTERMRELERRVAELLEEKGVLKKEVEESKRKVGAGKVSCNPYSNSMTEYNIAIS